MPGILSLDVYPSLRGCSLQANKPLLSICSVLISVLDTRLESENQLIMGVVRSRDQVHFEPRRMDECQSRGLEGKTLCPMKWNNGDEPHPLPLTQHLLNYHLPSHRGSMGCQEPKHNWMPSAALGAHNPAGRQIVKETRGALGSGCC